MGLLGEMPLDPRISPESYDKHAFATLRNPIIGRVEYAHHDIVVEAKVRSPRLVIFETT